MKQKIMVSLLCLVLLWAAPLWADVLSEADALYDSEEYVEGLELLKSSISLVSSDAQKAEYYWRMARLQLFVADDLEDEGLGKDELLSLFDAGRDYAAEAIELAPSADAYYWHSSNVGRWGETKGILDSLTKASPMRDDLTKVIEYDPLYADAWYVLGRLYMLLPGWPLSFGNTDYAVSYARRALAVYSDEDFKISYYKSLAETLWKRNDSSSTRNKNFSTMARNFGKKKDELSKMAYFEGTLGGEYKPEYAAKNLSQMSDRQEAVTILAWTLLKYDTLASPSRGEKNNIEEVRELLDEWQN